MRTRRWLVAALCAAALGAGSVPGRAEDPPRRPRRGPEASPGPLDSLNAVLGRPTDRSAVLSVLSAVDLEVFVEFGREAGKYAARTPPAKAAAGVPLEIPLEGLAPDAPCHYRLRHRRPGAGEFLGGEEAVFRTRRAPGSTFTFALQGDSHPEREGRMFDPALYERTLRTVAAERPDFYMTMGDDFSIDPLIQRGAATAETVDRVYAHQRGFLGLVGEGAPLYLVNGNHEAAARCLLDGTAGSPAVLAGRARNRFFPLPAPDAFYDGDREEVEFVGLPRDYYSWTWGDGLFVVLDFYWHSPVPVDPETGGTARHGEGGRGARGGKGARDLWEVTLGDAQYAWLRRTLEGSRARWKFVFAHHAMGTGRGGVEQTGFHEWGGRDRNGADRFAERRPGWAMPIHQLMAKNGVTIFFQGHDHLFARQEKDGVVYQEVPNPADATYTAFNREAYLSGDILPNSGHLRVEVAPSGVKVDYIRSWLPADERPAGPDGKGAVRHGEVAFSYEVGRRPGERPGK